MKVLDDFVIFGMINYIGILPLKHKNDAIYLLRPVQFEGGRSQTKFTKILTFGKILVFAGTSDLLYYCEIA
jgi:hypothetical protein